MPQAPSPPNSNAPVIRRSADGTMAFDREWYRFFASLGSPGADPAAVTLDPSPAGFVAPGTGTLFVSGGTVSAIQVIRGGTTVPTGVIAGAIPVTKNDEVVITYTVAPTVNYLGN